MGALNEFTAQTKVAPQMEHSSFPAPCSRLILHVTHLAWLQSGQSNAVSSFGCGFFGGGGADDFLFPYTSSHPPRQSPFASPFLRLRSHVDAPSRVTGELRKGLVQMTEFLTIYFGILVNVRSLKNSLFFVKYPNGCAPRKVLVRGCLWATMLFRRLEKIPLKGLDGLPADATSVSVTPRQQPVLRSRQPVPVERNAAPGSFKRPMLCNRVSAVVKSTCCMVSNPRRQDRRQREGTSM